MSDRDGTAGSAGGGNGAPARGSGARREHLELRADADRIRAMASRIAETGPALRSLGAERVAGALGQAAGLLADPDSELGTEARRALPEGTGLSPSMVDWALRTNVAPARPDALRALARRLQPPLPDRALGAPPRLVAVVLAGNVFTASLRAVSLPLLAGAPVVAKASSQDDGFPRLLERALHEVDPQLAASYGTVTFPGGSGELQGALLSQADAVAVYGSDATLAAVRARLGGTTRFIAHGHGLGALYVPAEALPDEDAAKRVAEAAALDVAAFDQRGCMSPHAVWVQRGGAVGAPCFARLLADHGLAALAHSLPRGTLPTAAGAAQLQWRGVAAARGELFEGDGFATSYEGDGALRLSPGYRNVSVLDCDGPADLARRLKPLGVHLKAIGVAGPHETRRRMAEALPPPLAPRVCAAGHMQTPPVDALADGESPWTGLTRWVEVD